MNPNHDVDPSSVQKVLRESQSSTVEDDTYSAAVRTWHSQSLDQLERRTNLAIESFTAYPSHSLAAVYVGRDSGALRETSRFEALPEETLERLFAFLERTECLALTLTCRALSLYGLARLWYKVTLWPDIYWNKTTRCLSTLVSSPHLACHVQLFSMRYHDLEYASYYASQEDEYPSIYNFEDTLLRDAIKAISPNVRILTFDIDLYYAWAASELVWVADCHFSRLQHMKIGFAGVYQLTPVAFSAPILTSLKCGAIEARRLLSLLPSLRNLNIELYGRAQVALTPELLGILGHAELRTLHVNLMPSREDEAYEHFDETLGGDDVDLDASMRKVLSNGFPKLELFELFAGRLEQFPLLMRTELFEPLLLSLRFPVVQIIRTLGHNFPDVQKCEAWHQTCPQLCFIIDPTSKKAWIRESPLLSWKLIDTKSSPNHPLTWI